VSKKGTSLKSGYLSTVVLSCMKMVADRHRHAAYHNIHWRQVSYECQHRWPWMTFDPKKIDFIWNDLYCVGWDVKPYSLTVTPQQPSTLAGWKALMKMIYLFTWYQPNSKSNPDYKSDTVKPTEIEVCRIKVLVYTGAYSSCLTFDSTCECILQDCVLLAAVRLNVDTS